MGSRIGHGFETSEHQYSRSRTGGAWLQSRSPKGPFIRRESQERFARYLDGSRNRCVRHRVRFRLNFFLMRNNPVFLLARRKMSFALIGILKRSPPYRVSRTRFNQSSMSFCLPSMLHLSSCALRHYVHWDKLSPAILPSWPRYAIYY